MPAARCGHFQFKGAFLKPISLAKLSANRANARRSTGPATDEGKAQSSRNNLRHGLCGVFDLMPFEKQEDFDTLLSALHAEHRPCTPTEEILVENMARHHWLAQRALRFQNRCLKLGYEDIDTGDKFALYGRYVASNERGFHKCLNDLLKLRAEMRKAELGFESQKRMQVEIESRSELNEVRLQLQRLPLAKAQRA